MTAKVDADGEYIKEWIPELEGVKSSDLSKWDNKKVRDKYKVRGYVEEPIVDHAERREMAIEMYKSV
jgi:deoxyribodipyrimidine photo-lyase